MIAFFIRAAIIGIIIVVMMKKRTLAANRARRIFARIINTQEIYGYVRVYGLKMWQKSVI